jgi:beta-glucosidase
MKQRWGFDGFLVGDWNGHAQVDGCTATDCVQAAKAGLDMYMAPDSWKALVAKHIGPCARWVAAHGAAR